MRGIIHVKPLHLTSCCRGATVMLDGLFFHTLKPFAFDPEDNIGPVNWHRRGKVPSCLLHHIKAIKLFVWERKGVEFQMVVQLVEYILKKAMFIDTRATKKEERIM
ncbi:hypothetical protein Gorai_003119, partial [Gossypium raimondii]|nr:hypothetical protein [Gossypium raimondii]